MLIIMGLSVVKLQHEVILITAIARKDFMWNYYQVSNNDFYLDVKSAKFSVVEIDDLLDDIPF